MKPRGYAGAPSSSPAQVAPSSREDQNDLLEQMLEGENLRLAYKRVVQNGGAPGVDGVTVAELQAYLKTHWERGESRTPSGNLQTGASQTGGNPQTRRRRKAARYPDRDGPLLQQALLQVMNPIFDAHFSWYSYGFRPGKTSA